LGMPSRRTNNFPESGRGLGHVTPTIFGSTVGYPSDSLASCSICYNSYSKFYWLYFCSTVDTKHYVEYGMRLYYLR